MMRRLMSQRYAGLRSALSASSVPLRGVGNGGDGCGRGRDAEAREDEGGVEEGEKVVLGVVERDEGGVGG